MKNKTFIDSIKCALKGLICAIKTEKNYKYYFVISFLFFIINLSLNIELIGFLCHIITTMGVFSAECINTSIEHFVDMTDKEIKPEIKLIKDIAAASILCWGIAFFLCEFILIGNALI